LTRPRRGHDALDGASWWLTLRASRAARSNPARVLAGRFYQRDSEIAQEKLLEVDEREVLGLILADLRRGSPSS
tara:strand:+ start:98 stop:319 length:222 start_codon:yes stop_codon:yes gene_type:complete